MDLLLVKIPQVGILLPSLGGVEGRPRKTLPGKMHFSGVSLRNAFWCQRKTNSKLI
jgi:hypothetical protein